MTRLHTSGSLRKLMSPRLLSLGLCSLLGATSAHATLLVYEGFNYTDGLTNTASASGSSSATGVAASGTGLTGDWKMNRGATTGNLNGTSFTTSAPLTLSGLSSSNSRLQWTSSNSSGASANYLTASLTADVSTALTVNKTSQIWLSYLVKTDAFPTSGSSGGIYLGRGNSGDTTGTMTAANSLIGFGYNSAGNAIITSSTGTKATSGSTQFGPVGTMKWVVANFSFTSAGISSANIWVRDTYTGTEGDLGTTAATFSGTAFSGSVVGSQLVLVTGSSPANVGFDEVRIGTTFLDVAPSASAIPEPSSAAFIAAGACGLLVCLRRRRITN